MAAGIFQWPESETRSNKNLDTVLHSIILSLLPIAELRGGIPYAVASGISVPVAYAICVAANLLVIPIVFLFLDTLHGQFYKVSLYRRVFDFYHERTTRKAERNVRRWGYWGVMMFVAIPLPVTGAYTGTFAAWILKLDRRKCFWYLALGVAIAGCIVTVATLTGIGILRIFVK
jgi:uncharacterized membrane protein